MPASSGFDFIRICLQVLENIELMRFLLAQGAKINAQCVLGTPLQFASRMGNSEALKCLLENKAEMDLGLEGSRMPLSCAIKADSLSCIDLLLQAGAKLHVGGHGFDERPLCLAASLGFTEPLKHLLSAGADPNTVDEFGLTPLEHAALVNGKSNGVEELFRVTKKLERIQDWSPSGVIAFVNSDKAFLEQRDKKREEIFKIRISKGEEAIKNEDYKTAVLWLELASEINSEDVQLHSYLSLCWAGLDACVNALTEAATVQNLDPNSPEGFLREGIAWILRKEFAAADYAFWKGFKLDPNNEEIEKEFRYSLREAEGRYKHWIILQYTQCYEDLVKKAIDDIGKDIPI